MGVVQLVQRNTKILLKHREPSSAKISLHLLTQSTWKTDEEREGKDSGSAPLLAFSGWVQPLALPCLLPCCLVLPQGLDAGTSSPAAVGQQGTEISQHKTLRMQKQTASVQSLTTAPARPCVAKKFSQSCSLSFCALVRGSRFFFYTYIYI